MDQPAPVLIRRISGRPQLSWRRGGGTLAHCWPVAVGWPSGGLAGLSVAQSAASDRAKARARSQLKLRASKLSARAKWEAKSRAPRARGASERTGGLARPKRRQILKSNLAKLASLFTNNWPLVVVVAAAALLCCLTQRGCIIIMALALFVLLLHATIWPNQSPSQREMTPPGSRRHTRPPGLGLNRPSGQGAEIGALQDCDWAFAREVT